MAHDIDIDKWVKNYMLVFAALLVGTVITVAVSYLDLSAGPAVAVALFIAAAKGSLVVLFFMHLIDEKKLIYWLLALAVLFFVFELLIPMFTESNSIDMGS